MHLPLRRCVACLCAAVLLLTAAPLPPARAELAAAEADAVRRAGKYFRTDKRRAFNKQVQRLAQDSVYQPLAAYWRSILALRGGDAAAVEALIDRAASPYLTLRARNHLMEHYAKRRQWEDFSRHAEAAGGCAATLALLAGESASAAGVHAAVQEHWRADAKMDDALCRMLYRRAYKQGLLTENDVWIKLRTLAGDRKLGPSHRLLTTFPGFVSYRSVRNVVRRATRYIQGKHGLGTRAQRELVMISAMVAARRNPKTALRRWTAFSQYFSEEENDHVWTVLATWAARWHRDDALQLFARTSGTYASEQSRAWYVRAALRAGKMAQALEGISAMPPAEAQLSAWRYWRAIAMQEAAPVAAQEALRALALEEDDYYGLLAREAVGMPLIDSAPPPAVISPPQGDFQLALALRRAGLVSLARSTWRHAVRSGAGKMPLLAAAHAAAAADWPLASIDAAIYADDAIAHHLRYPLLYRAEIGKHSDKRGLDLAFVYGLIHQESRFMPKIVSSAKARGLMQVIPSTARQVARANRYTKYRLSRLTRVDTNVIIGTTYLLELAGRFNAAPAMVAAAYNAGPTRVHRWYRASPQLLVAIENIPITETRLYVKYLLANRMHYQARLGRPLPTMRENITRSILAAAQPAT